MSFQALKFRIQVILPKFFYKKIGSYLCKKNPMQSKLLQMGNIVLEFIAAIVDE